MWHSTSTGVDNLQNMPSYEVRVHVTLAKSIHIEMLGKG